LLVDLVKLISIAPCDLRVVSVVSLDWRVRDVGVDDIESYS
jgi:hypothetical protein